jgi:hypothetical protein
MKKRQAILQLGVVCACVLAGFGLKTVFAGGAPTLQTLYYSGTLLEGGQPVTGPRPITVNLWANSPVTQGETPLCTTVPGTTNVVNGRFRVPLPSNCTSAISSDPNTYVEVLDNGTSLGLTAVGAVPYAVEANHALNADNAMSATSATSATNATNASSAANAADGGGIATALGALASSVSAIQVPIITEWAPYTPTLLAGGEDLSTSTTSSGFWRRVGDTMEVQISTTFNTCPSPGGEVYWYLPTTNTVDIKKSPQFASLGSGVASLGTANEVLTLNVTSQGAASYVGVDVTETTTGGANCNTVGPGGVIRMTVRAPITNWTVYGVADGG